MTHMNWRRWVAAAACVAAAGVFPNVALANESSDAAAALKGTTLQNVPSVLNQEGASIPSSVTPDKDGKITVFIETKGQSGLDRRAEVKSQLASQRMSAKAKETQADAAARESAASAQKTADKVASQLQKIDSSATILYKASYTLSGFAVRTTQDAVNKLIDKGQVVRVRPVTMAEPLTTTTSDVTATGDNGVEARNGNNDSFVSALKVWQQGNTGKDATVAVIDTGLDYTHADFGGRGTTDAYAAALASTDDPLKNATLKTLLDPNKYLGGTDFAGADYDGQYVTTPTPDDNPIDGEGGHHGTHVAGTALGYGVTKEGKTFTGDYAKLSSSDVKSMEVAPGAAPNAGIYALKVFGDNGGSTGLVGEALEWVAKHNAEEGSRKIDIVSMSLGGTFGTSDDAETVMVDALTKNDVLSVVAAGNEGDITDIEGSPSTAKSSLAVAASQSGSALQDGATVAGPDDLKGTVLSGQYSVNYKDLDDFNVTAPVVRVKDENNLDGCSTYSTADQNAVKGKIAYVDWNDADVACGSGTRFNNAEAAGAVGIMFGSQSNILESGIAGNADLPGFNLVKDSDEKIQSALDAGTLEVTLSSAQRQSVNSDYDEAADTIASFTSRGLHGSYDGTVKPDVAAPGVGIVSASAGTGTGREVMSGTSMATPLTSGVAALVRTAHPDWTASETKTDIINTATHDITTADRTTVYSPLRVGTGRIDAYAAVNNNVRAEVASDDSSVTAQFGVIELTDQPYSAQKTITVTNDTDQDRSYDVSYVARTAMPGVQYSLSADNLTVVAHSTGFVVVTLTIADPTALRHTMDPTQTANYPTTFDLKRNFVSDSSGVVEFTPTGTNDGSALRVAVSAAPKPTAKATSTVFLNSDSDVEGTWLTYGEYGPWNIEAEPDADRFEAYSVQLQLGDTDPVDAYRAPGVSVQNAGSADIRAFGAMSTVNQTTDPSKAYLVFGIETDQPWIKAGTAVIPEVVIDANSDNVADYIVYATSTDAATKTTTDSTWAQTLDLATGQIVDREPLTDATNAIVDKNGNAVEHDLPSVYDSNTIALPVKLSALGLTADSENTKIAYQVQTESAYATHYDAYSGQTTSVADTGRMVTFDPFHPDMSSADQWDSQNGGSFLSGLSNETREQSFHLSSAAAAKTVQPWQLYLGAHAPTATEHASLELPAIKAGDDDTKTADLRLAKFALAVAQKLDASTYDETSWKTFSDARDALSKTIATENVKQSEVDAAVNTLITAQDSLTGKDVTAIHTDQLQAITDLVTALNKDDFKAADGGDQAAVDSAWTKIFGTDEENGGDLADANTVLKYADQIFDQDMVAHMYKVLFSDYRSLVAATASTGTTPTPSVDKTALQAAVDAAKKLNEADYTADSWKAFADALAAAEQVLNDANATQEQVDAAAAALAQAQAGLKEVEPSDQADKAVLQAAVDAAKALKQADYTADSWKALADALAAAEQVLNDANATQEQVDAAAAALAKAQAGLKRVSTSDNGNNGGNDNGSTKPNDGKDDSKDDAKDKADSLSNTGSNVAVIAALAALAVMTGAVTMAIRRRH